MSRVTSAATGSVARRYSWTRRGRQRRLVDEEAEAQVVEGERPQVVGQPAARPQPGAEPADDLRPVAVMADEGDVAALLAARRRLADVVEEGAEAKRGAPGHLVGEGLGEQLRDLAGALAGEALQVGLDLQRVPEHREGVAVDVEVVVGALPDAAQRLQLGQDDRGEAQLVEQGEAAQRVGAADQQAQLRELALPRRIGGAGGFGAGQGGGPGVDRQAQLGRQPRRAEQAQRVLGEAARRRPRAGTLPRGRRGRRRGRAARRRPAGPRRRRP